MTWARRSWRWLTDHAASRWASVVVTLAALVVHTAQSVVWPVVEGRDYVTYMRVYAEMWRWESVIPWELLWRLPVAPAVLGPPLDIAGPAGARVFIALLFAATVLVWYRIGLRFGAAPAVLLAASLLLYPAFGALFHRYSSDAVTGVVFALFALALARAWERPSAWRFVVLGLSIVVLALTRPANQVLVLFFLVPLLLRAPLRVRVGWAAACIAAMLIPLGAWAAANSARYDDLALSRGGGAWLPFYRVYLTERIVDPSNGSASRELAAAVRRDLLVREPYRSYGITLDDVFRHPTTRYHEDLVSLSDRVWGWDSNYSVLRRAALEAISRHPGAFAEGLARSLLEQLTQWFPLLPPAVEPPEPAVKTIEVEGKTLPRPSEGGTIPAASVSYWLGRPDGAFDEEWTSPVDHHIVSTRPELLAQLDRMGRRVEDLRLPPAGDGSITGARWLNRASRLYPRSLLWLAVGIVGVCIRRPRRSGLAIAIAGAAMLVVVATLLAVPPVDEFVIPLFPAFALLGLVGLTGGRSDGRATAA